MKKATSIEMASVLGLYVKRWQRWVAAGLQGIVIVRDNDQQFPAGIQRIYQHLHGIPASRNTVP
jgi:hypothetical protein